MWWAALICVSPTFSSNPSSGTNGALRHHTAPSLCSRDHWPFDCEKSSYNFFLFHNMSVWHRKSMLLGGEAGPIELGLQQIFSFAHRLRMLVSICMSSGLLTTWVALQCTSQKSPWFQTTKQTARGITLAETLSSHSISGLMHNRRKGNFFIPKWRQQQDARRSKLSEYVQNAKEKL